MSASPARWVTALRRNARLLRTLARMSGMAVMACSATARSAAKLFFPPNQ